MKRLIWLAVLAIGLFAASCVTPSQVSYLRDVEYGVDYDARPAPELKLQPEDRIRVQVFSEDPTLAIPFNAGIITQEGNAVSTPLNGYTVDKDGNIDFPVLGLMQVEGKTIKQVKEMIAGQIQQLGYIKNPVVNINMENFRITIIGEMQPSVITVPGTSMTLLEAIASATVAQERRRITDVMVIRTENGQRKAYSVNLQKKALFDSPVYYLQQNDIIYVKPKGWRMSSTTQTIVQSLNMALSMGSMITSILVIARQ